MKKLSYLLLILSFIAFIGCDEEDIDDVQFSTLTPELHKKAIQEDVTDVVAKLESVQELEAVQVMEELVGLFGEFFGAKAFAPVLNATKSMADPKLFANSSDAFSISSEFEEISGIYHYIGDDEFEIEDSDSEFTVYFTSEIVGDCVFSMYGLKVKDVSNDFVGNEVAELPTALKAHLKAGKQTLLELNFSASYDKKDAPESIDFSVSASPFVTSLNFKRSKSSLSFDYALKEGKSNIIAVHLDSKGDFDMDKITDMIEADFDDESEAFIDQEVLNEANAWVAVGNLKADGFANFKGVKEFLQKEEKLDYQSPKEDFEEVVDGLNKNIKVYLRYNDSNQVIAKGEFYVYEDRGRYDTLFDFVFSDGSAIDESFADDILADYIEFISSILGDDWLDDDDYY